MMRRRSFIIIFIFITALVYAPNLSAAGGELDSAYQVIDEVVLYQALNGVDGKLQLLTDALLPRDVSATDYVDSIQETQGLSIELHPALLRILNDVGRTVY
jgi:hypothetical protein